MGQPLSFFLSPRSMESLRSHKESSCSKGGTILTLIAELGQSKRDKISNVIPAIQAFADSNSNNYVQWEKTVSPRIGPDSWLKSGNWSAAVECRNSLLCRSPLH